MASQKLVRCEIRRPEDPNGASIRYVPLEIYGLWEFLMTEKHGFEVLSARSSLWLDSEEAPEAAYDQQVNKIEELRAEMFERMGQMIKQTAKELAPEERRMLADLLRRPPPAPKST